MVAGLMEKDHRRGRSVVVGVVVGDHRFLIEKLQGKPVFQGELGFQKNLIDRKSFYAVFYTI